MIKTGGYYPVTACSGRPMPGTLALQGAILSRFRDMTNGGIYNCRKIAGTNVWSIHAGGRAGDTMTGTGQPTTISKVLAEQLRVFSANLGVQGIIHNRKDWFSNQRHVAWTRYNGSNPHVDHIHWEQDVFACQTLTLAVALRILAGPSPDGPVSRPTLLVGAMGDYVWTLQGRLNAHGYGLTEDGEYGPKTDVAVRSFQRIVGLTVDGIVGRDTWGRLR